VRQIRLNVLNRLYDFVIVKTDDGERECHPRDVKPGEIVELPVDDSKSLDDLALFQVLPDLNTPAGVVERLLSEDARVGGTNAEGTLRIIHGPYPSAEAVPHKPNEMAWKSDPGKWWAVETISPESREADRLYDLAQAEHQEWWDGIPDAFGEELDEFTEHLMDKFFSTYGVEEGSTLADLIYEHILAGLT